MQTLNGTASGRMCFGTMQFGGRADEAASRAMFEACLEAGVTHFDTAHVYNDGASERLLGAMIGDRRSDLLVASKVGYTGGASRGNISAQFDITQSRLGLDVVDILYLHRFDPDTDLRETFHAFADLKAAGRIRYIGLSNFAAWQVVKAIGVAAEFGVRVDIFQPMYNLVKRQAEVEILPMCIDQGVVCAPYSPLGGGLLTGKYSGGQGGRLTEDARYGARYGVDWMHETARQLAALGAEIGEDPARLAVAWVMAHPAKPTPIVSGNSVKQLAPSLAALSYDMTPVLYDRISNLSQTPVPATDRLEEQQ